MVVKSMIIEKKTLCNLIKDYIKVIETQRAIAIYVGKYFLSLYIAFYVIVMRNAMCFT